MLTYQTVFLVLIQCLQREDPGALVQLGYTAGSRSRPHIDWARNIRRKLPRGTITDLNYRSSSVFALAWNAFRMQLPAEVIKDFDDYLTDSEIFRMDPSGRKQKGEKGAYTICDEGEPITFQNVEMAPPAGVVGANYTRYIQFPL
jgi:hypothetical protein